MSDNLTAEELYQRSPEIMKKWECLQCGFCCKHFKLGVKKDDWERWDGIVVDSKIGKFPLREFCNLDKKEYSKKGDLFFHPESGEKFDECPFLEERSKKFYCMIHDPEIKPTICSEWHTKIIDLRCTNTRNIINKMYDLRFDTKMDEWIYYEGIIREYIKIYQTKNTTFFFKTLLDLIKTKSS